jgi:hypothetical protein
MQPCDSFFNFFSPPELPGDDAELDEEEEENLHSLLEECTSLRRAIVSRQSSHACAVAVFIEPCLAGAPTAMTGAKRVESVGLRRTALDVRTMSLARLSKKR